MISLMECDVSSPGDYWKAEGARLQEGRGEQLRLSGHEIS